MVLYFLEIYVIIILEEIAGGKE